MPTQRTKFGFPAQPSAKATSRQEIFRPTLGLHDGDIAQDLQPGFTPAARNFVTQRGFIEPRSGLSSFQGMDFGEPVLGGREVFSIDGELGGFAASEGTVAFVEPSGASWSVLSYLKGSGVSGLAADDDPSGLSTNYWSASVIYESQSEKNICVFSNNTNWAKFFYVDGSTTTFSDFTYADSIESTKAARSVTAVNDRLVLFNTLSSTGTRFPTRVLWSERGSPTGFDVNSGAGAEDLMDMQGEGLAAVRARDVIMLFTEEEIWAAVPTLDDYAFRFQRITDQIGCPYPRTARATPLGVIFLSRDLEVYVTDGSRVEPLGPVQRGEPSRIQGLLKEQMVEPSRAWAAYSAVGRRYELFYAAAGSTYPNRALLYHIDDRSWMPQRFDGHELSFGFDQEDTGEAVRWSNLEGSTWGELNSSWGGLGDAAENRYVTVADSNGSVYRLRDDQNDDDGTTIDARWRSHGLNQRDQMRRVHLSEVWVDYEADVASRITLLTAEADASDLTAASSVTLSPNAANAFVPLWKTAQSPVFELRVGDGSQPQIARFQATLKDAGRFGG